MITDTPGMKVLLLDEETTPIVSLVYTQSEILQKEVYLLERVSNSSREVMTHLKAIVFVRPTQASIDALVTELKRPKYGQYDIFFSNVVKSTQLERLAEADEHEVVREVQEYFADYYALAPSLYTLNLTGCIGDTAGTWEPEILKRSHQGLTALLLSLKRRPIIRYQGSSGLCKRLAHDVGSSVQRETNLFDFRQQTDTPPILLIVDRRDDPVTPLLNQWTYQAMVHELLGIHKNRVDLSKVPNISKELKEVVLSPEQDAFYRDSLLLNFGEIGESIKKLVEEFQAKSKKNKKMESIADMKAFVESYPEFRAMSGSVSKHVSVVGELSRLVDVYDLLDLSACEQDLVCQSDHKEIIKVIDGLLDNPKIRVKDKVRLVMLYALRYEKSATSLDAFTEKLAEWEVSAKHRRLIDRILQYAGNSQEGRESDLFGTKGAAGLFKKMTGGLKGVENIYTQHSPLLQRTLEQIKTGKLKDTMFPFFDVPGTSAPQDVIVFMVGGTTYAESRVVQNFNKANPNMRVLLGGSSIHNFDTFIDEILTRGGNR